MAFIRLFHSETFEAAGLPQLYGLSFNQDFSLFSISLDIGFRIFTSEPLKERSRTDGGICITSMLNKSNYLALVGGGRNPKYSPNKVVIWDAAKNQPVIELEFKNEVKSVLLRKECIVVVLMNAILVYSFESMPRKLASFETCDNPNGIAVLCSSESNSMFAFPGRKPGHVHIIDIFSLFSSSTSSAANPSELLKSTQTAIIAAHTTEISSLALNREGTLLATASSKGTLIRVFETATGKLLHELRRGSDRADIWSISFNFDSSRLCVGSDKGTVHVFNLDSSSSQQTQSLSLSSSFDTPSGSSPGNRQSSFSFMKDLLPKYFSSEWSFAHCHVPSEAKFICSFGQDQQSLIVLSVDGAYYKFTFDPEKGGECSRLTYHRLLREE